MDRDPSVPPWYTTIKNSILGLSGSQIMSMALESAALYMGDAIERLSKTTSSLAKTSEDVKEAKNIFREFS